MRALRIGLIGDHDESVTAHRAIPVALRLAGDQLGRTVEFDWLATDAMPDAQGLASFDALWCVPASPYRDMDAALRAIRFAREQRRPFLGTCGGFQHSVILRGDVPPLAQALLRAAVARRSASRHDAQLLPTR